MFFCFSPWLLKAGVAAVAVAAIWCWLPTTAILARLAGADLSGPSQVSDLIEWSTVRFEDFANGNARGLGDPGGGDPGSTDVTPLAIQASGEATAR
ncbi:hypothetical protein [Pseudobythopirellula maris]|uniref:hypothetical protein n=1 Tax=Pseudobythopirellula maris TaxID=2527991 RepID=UPI0011B8244B|nr:hypothetical protein [Pseudobythopirellula maris]